MILKLLLFPLAVLLCFIAWAGECADDAYWWLYHTLDGDGWLW